jgi:enoyl-CoA hydratase/carnithine racemase
VAEHARLERDGDLGVLVIENPPLNLFTAQMVSDIMSALDASDGCRALLVRAEGRYFTGGVDVNVFAGLSEADAAQLTADLMAITHRLEELPFPTMASVHALCLTAGLELALACDLIWAAESARFGLVETVIGLTPLMGGTQRIAERAGPARARELVMSGDLYDAATLERWNVVNRVLPDSELEAESLAFARRLAEGPTRAHDATKRIVRDYLEKGVRGADEATAGIGAPLFETQDLRQAVQTFLAEGPGNAKFRGQ